MDHVGTWLARARVEAGMSVDDIARATRLRPSIIAAVEETGVDPFDSIFYFRANVWAIASAIGVNPDEALARLDTTVGPPTGTAK